MVYSISKTIYVASDKKYHIILGLVEILWYKILSCMFSKSDYIVFWGKDALSF